MIPQQVSVTITPGPISHPAFAPSLHYGDNVGILGTEFGCQIIRIAKQPGGEESSLHALRVFPLLFVTRDSGVIL